jgi:hypothetical protein
MSSQCVLMAAWSDAQLKETVRPSGVTATEQLARKKDGSWKETNKSLWR